MRLAVRDGPPCYVAGGAALNELLRAPLISRDIDMFHDTEEALAASWEADRASLARDGCTVSVIREREMCSAPNT